MAYRITPGVRQDHRGRLYQVAGWPHSSKTIMVPYVPKFPLSKPFQFRFLSAEGGHVWNFGERVQVQACGRDSCLVCGSKRQHTFEVITS